MRTGQSSKIASDVSSLINEFEEQLPDSIRESITKQYREASDKAYEYVVEDRSSDHRLEK